MASESDPSNISEACSAAYFLSFSSTWAKNAAFMVTALLGIMVQDGTCKLGSHGDYTYSVALFAWAGHCWRARAISLLSPLEKRSLQQYRSAVRQHPSRFYVRTG